MTKQEGKGVEVMLGLLEAMCRQLTESGCRSYIDGLKDDEAAAMAITISSAERALTGQPSLLYETLAARVTGVDVETFSSKPGVTEGVRIVPSCCVPVNNEGVCVRDEGHEGAHSIFRFESDMRTN